MTKEEFEAIKPKLEDGVKVSCRIDETDIEDAMLIKENNNTYLLQNVYKGHPAQYKKGYKYSWLVTGAECWDMFNIQIKEEEKQEPITSDVDSLLAEAKRRYPVGTKFYPAHLDQTTKYCIVTNTTFEYQSNEIYTLTDEGHVFDDEEKYGNAQYNRIVYCDGKWAEIIESPKEKEKRLDTWYVLWDDSITEVDFDAFIIQKKSEGYRISVRGVDNDYNGFKKYGVLFSDDWGNMKTAVRKGDYFADYINHHKQIYIPKTPGINNYKKPLHPNQCLEVKNNYDYKEILFLTTLEPQQDEVSLPNSCRAIRLED